DQTEAETELATLVGKLSHRFTGHRTGHIYVIKTRRLRDQGAGFFEYEQGRKGIRHPRSSSPCPVAPELERPEEVIHDSVDRGLTKIAGQVGEGEAIDGLRTGVLAVSNLAEEGFEIESLSQCRRCIAVFRLDAVDLPLQGVFCQLIDCPVVVDGPPQVPQVWNPRALLVDVLAKTTPLRTRELFPLKRLKENDCEVLEAGSVEAQLGKAPDVRDPRAPQEPLPRMGGTERVHQFRG